MIPRPPLHLIHLTGSPDEQDFDRAGQATCQSMRDAELVHAGDNVLDIGCGCGRIAIPLTTYVTGIYRGFDIVEESIRWCQEKITPRYPHFQFCHADIRNNRYNPHGTLNACEFDFPYEGASFDVVYLGSVFTHMLPKDMNHYVREIHRVLRKNGKCLVSFFLINDESSDLIARGQSAIAFVPANEGYWVGDRDVHEAAVAYSEDYMDRMFRENSFLCELKIYGSWCGRRGALKGRVTSPAAVGEEKRRMAAMDEVIARAIRGGGVGQDVVILRK